MVGILYRSLEGDRRIAYENVCISMTIISVSTIIVKITIRHANRIVFRLPCIVPHISNLVII